MTKRWMRTALLAALFTAASAVTAFADTRITNVSIRSGAPGDLEVISGTTVAPEFSTSSHMFTIDVTDVTTGSSESPKREHTYELRLDAEPGYYFPRESSVTVNVTNVTDIVRKKTEDDTTFILRVKAWPYYQWPEVEGITGVDADSEKITWSDEHGADKWEYVLEYEDTYANPRTKHGTTTRNYLDVKSYNKEYTGSNHNGDRQDSRVIGFAVRAVGRAGSNPRTLDGVWKSVGDVDYSEYEGDYSSWHDALGSAGNSGSVSSGGSTSHPGSSGSTGSVQLPGYVVRGTWIDHGNGQWSFTDTNGKLYRSEWAAVDNSRYANTAMGQEPFDWFYFDANGYMYTGWLTEPGTGHIFYLQEESNGTRGRMYTGWNKINGVDYYFNELSDGTRGRLMQ